MRPGAIGLLAVLMALFAGLAGCGRSLSVDTPRNGAGQEVDPNGGFAAPGSPGGGGGGGGGGGM